MLFAAVHDPDRALLRLDAMSAVVAIGGKPDVARAANLVANDQLDIPRTIINSRQGRLQKGPDDAGVLSRWRERDQLLRDERATQVESGS